MNTQNAVLELELKSIAASKLNPRKHCDPVKMAQLVASVKEQGVRLPVMVRPAKSGTAAKYEIVYGERRYRASITAGKKTIPCIIKELSDVQSLELMTIENLDREDVHPLEEAEGYETLLKMKSCKTADDLAIKVGKSKSYIYGRLKLLELIPDNRKLFYDGRLSASVALLVSRIPKDLQKKAGRYCAGIGNGNGEPLSYNSAQEHIQEDYMLLLKEAPFDTKDKTLSGKVGSCVDCPKRTGNQRELFADIKSADVCTDVACFKEKQNAFIQRMLEKLKQSGKKIMSVEEAKKLFTYSHQTTLNKYYNLDETNYDMPKSIKYRDLVKRVKGIEIIYVVQPFTGQLLEFISQLDLPKIFKQLGIKQESIAGTSSAYRSVDLEKSKTKNRIEEARRWFWINKLQARNDVRCMNVIILDELLHDLSGYDADKIVPFKSEKSYGNSWDIPKLYALGNMEVQKLILKAVSVKYSYLDVDDLKFLSSELGYDVAKDYVITETYLQAMTKEQLLKLAEEMSIKVEKMAEDKKDTLVEFILKHAPKGKVPKELKK